MAKTSIIIPSCNEIAVTNGGVNVLQKTIQDIYLKATGDFEVIVGFNGPNYQYIHPYPNLRVLKLPENIGLKTMINVLAIMAKGKYIYKTDAHCMFGKGFDEILQADMQDNWLVTPRFYVLDAKEWKWQDERHYDYFFMHCPLTDNRGYRFKAGGHWPERTLERENKPEYIIDETPQIHGSGWFVNREYFLETLGGFPNIDHQGHAQEPIWLALKNWLIGGKVIVNKKTWYAHFHQDGSVKGYRYTREEERHTYNITARYWMANKESGIIHNIQWFVNEKFPNMPTWPSNWQELQTQYERSNS